MSNFWGELKKPFFVMAPMDDVTDIVFRDFLTEVSPPDVLFTEFTNVEGLQSKGRDKLLPRLWFTKSNIPTVAQIWGKNPENYFKTAQEIKKMGFSGIDINMGCPERKVVKNGCCSALIENPSLAKEIIEAVIKGAGGLPVSVKTRCGLSSWKTEEWITFLLQFNLSAITLHGRIAKEMSKNPANWDEIKKAVEIRNKLKSKTLIVGNGDIKDYEDGLEKAEKYGVDGLMIGRGVFHDIQVFTQTKNKKELTKEDRLKLLKRHTEMFKKVWGDKKNFLLLRKFYKIYLSNFDGALDLRAKFMEVKNYQEVDDLLRNAV